ncbi:MAG: hypothetical protein HY514_00110 [Candidatus Aenigmarchaeota archaeon]|nr:hypothetical protein [Candidatus Aenigmarchaeota archaeon]
MIAVAVKDVFFAAKITETAGKLDKKIVFVADDKDLVKFAKKKPELIIADLNAFSIGALKKVKKKDTIVIGFLSHVQTDLRKEAEKVCDVVVTQSEFTKKLPDILSKI